MSTAHWQARRLPIPAAWPVRSSPAARPWAIISAGLGLAERLTSSIQDCWPFIIAVALRRIRRPRPGPAIGGSGGVKDGLTARARARRQRQGARL